MKLSTLVLTLAVLGGLANLAPAGGAISAGCIDLTAVVAPVNAPTNGWAPDCINAKMGDAITFVNADDVSHEPALKIGTQTCFRGDEIATGGTTGVSFAVVAGVLKATSAAGVKSCAVGGSANQGIFDKGDHYEIHYWCALHTTAMTGVINVAK